MVSGNEKLVQPLVKNGSQTPLDLETSILARYYSTQMFCPYLLSEFWKKLKTRRVNWCIRQNIMCVTVE